MLFLAAFLASEVVSFFGLALVSSDSDMEDANSELELRTAVFLVFWDDFEGRALPLVLLEVTEVVAAAPGFLRNAVEVLTAAS